MKIKNLFSVISLGLFALASVGAAMFNKSEAVPARADGENTWMFRFEVDLHEPMAWQGEELNSFYVHYWGTNISGTDVELSEWSDDVFVTHIALKDNQTVTGLMVKFKQGSAEKNSQDISCSISKEEHNQVYHTAFTNSWDGSDKWAPASLSWSDYIYLNDDNSSTTYYFEEDAKNSRFKLASFTVDEENAYDGVSVHYFSLRARTDAWNNEIMLFRNREYIRDGYTFLAGQYDIFLYGSYSTGFLTMYKYESIISYIYYVTDSKDPSIDYIYAWSEDGETLPFGAWPGKAIDKKGHEPEPETSAGQEVTGNAILHFQNNEKLIYKIPLTIGYPNGSYYFQLNNGSDSSKTENLKLVPGAAYWWTGGANVTAGIALDFLIAAEAKRNAVAAAGDIKQFSICGISKGDATILVNDYNALDEDIRTTYIDSSTVYTYDPSDKDSETMVSYRAVMEQLGKIAGVNVVGLSRVSYDLGSSAFTSTIAVVIIATSITTAVCLAFVMIKKSKRQ